MTTSSPATPPAPSPSEPTPSEPSANWTAPGFSPQSSPTGPGAPAGPARSDWSSQPPQPQQPYPQQGHPPPGYPYPAAGAPDAFSFAPNAAPNAAPPGYGWPAPLRPDYAHWGRRVGASLIDSLPALIGVGLFYAGIIPWYVRTLSAAVRGALPAVLNPFTPLTVIGLAVLTVSLVLNLLNRWLLAGRTGQSLGKRVAKIWLINEQTGQPIGPLMAFARDLLHRIDGVFYVGFLWPLWDEKHQTFADKILKTVVVTTPPAPGASVDAERSGRSNSQERSGLSGPTN